MQDLTGQVTELDNIIIDDSKPTDSCDEESHESRTAESARTDNDDKRVPVDLGVLQKFLLYRVGLRFNSAWGRWEEVKEAPSGCFYSAHGTRESRLMILKTQVQLKLSLARVTCDDLNPCGSEVASREPCPGPRTPDSDPCGQPGLLAFGPDPLKDELS